MEKYLADGKKLQCLQDDITKLSVDAIVNAANEQLAHGGGVAKAISKAGGRLVQKQSTEWVKKHGQSIAFPAIRTGIFGYPLKKCAEIMISESIEFLKSGSSVKHIIFCLFNQKAYDTFVEELSGK